MTQVRSKFMHDDGFTLMEMLIAVGILTILMGLGFIAVQNHMRGMKRTELDETAKEIYVAAQNHLSIAESMGILDKRIAAAKSDPDNAANIIGTRYVQNGHVRYCFFVGLDESPDDAAFANGVLYDMLPKFSIDDTVRTSGSYAIEYELESATVTNVYYSDSDERLSGYSFVATDYDALFGLGSVYMGSDAENIDARTSGYTPKNDSGSEQRAHVIGWYGGEDARDLARIELYAPKVELINDECLEVKVSFRSPDLNRMITRIDADAFVQVEVKGETSGAKLVLSGDSNGESEDDQNVTDSIIAYMSGGSEIKDGTVYRYRKYVIDDITAIGSSASYKQNHFAELSGENAPEERFLPGEDIEVEASVTLKDALLANAGAPATATGNSLFREIKNGVIYVSKVRHLENLDAAISGFDREKLGLSDVQIVNQAADLQWAGDGKKNSKAFLDKILAEKDWRGGQEDKAADVRVRTLDGTATKAGTFAPVTPQAVGAQQNDYKPYTLTYNGNKKRISTVKVDVDAGSTAENVGIFSTVVPGSSIKDLELVDCSAKTTKGSAGVLLGAASGTASEKVTLANVLAHDSRGSVQSKVEGTTAAGGLAGQLEEATIDGCGASVLVSATDSGASAGGLVGILSGSTTVDNSYAGGHTKEGTGMYDSEEYNVTAAQGTAGGLVGTASDVTFANCYATTSVSGGTADANSAGGFVGSASGATMTNCYATGLIGGTEEQTAKRGAFAGSLTSPTLSENKFYEIINNTLPPVGNVETVEEEQIVALDKDLDTFKAFYAADARTEPGEPGAKPTRLDKAVPYDSQLAKLYKQDDDSIYPLRTIRMLNPDATDEWKTEHYWATSHYGDWPAPETLVVNTPTS